MPIFSLPSPYGIGTIGKAAKDFVDFLALSGQTYWQILPTGHTGFGDSPYQPFSSFAGNPYFIDLDILKDSGYLKSSDLVSLKKSGKIDYGNLYETRYPILRKAYKSFHKDAKFSSFCEKNVSWLEDYALFMAIKNEKCGCDVFGWEAPLRHRNPEALEEARKRLYDDIEFYKVLQFWFFQQWAELKTYANKKGVYIIGDIPIYVSRDSSDIWAEPEQFMLDKEGYPQLVAGVPPDAFSDEGQLWGNPLYDWKYMKKTGYEWWCRRIKAATELFDVIRIDHFRGFDEFFAIPKTSNTAKDGRWKKGPGMTLFKAIKEKVGDVRIIAEDLGYLTPSVLKLLKNSGYPGMAVLQFAFSPDGKSKYLPHKIEENSVVYTGTHDNDTIIGWLESADKDVAAFCKAYLRLNTMEGYNWGMIKAALSTKADTAIICMQDLMGLGSEARVNTPSTDGGNWTWRMDEGCANEWLAKIMYDITATYGRLGDSKE